MKTTLNTLEAAAGAPESQKAVQVLTQPAEQLKGAFAQYRT